MRVVQNDGTPCPVCVIPSADVVNCDKPGRGRALLSSVCRNSLLFKPAHSSVAFPEHKIKMLSMVLLLFADLHRC